VERTLTPGANRSTLVRPTLEKLARASRLSVAPTQTMFAAGMTQG
jgi:hypothetical protein